jgi:hypothetical protein
VEAAMRDRAGNEPVEIPKSGAPPHRVNRLPQSPRLRPLH